MQNKKIGLVGVSSRLTLEELEKAVSALSAEYGVEIAISDAVLTQMPLLQKAEQFIAMAFDEKIDFLLCARGGEGCADLIPFLEPFREKFKTASHKKNLVGMSDNTPLLLFLADLGWPVFYGPVASYFSRELTPETRESFEQLLGASSYSKGLDFNLELSALNEEAKRLSLIEAEVTGGNLTLLNLSLKESWEFNAENKILVIEDWHEAGYAIDRTLKHLERIGKFLGVKAVIFGNFIGDILAGDFMTPDQIKSIQDALERFSARANFPVFECKNIGHVKALKLIKFGPCRIDKNLSGNWELQTTGTRIPY